MTGPPDEELFDGTLPGKDGDPQKHGDGQSGQRAGFPRRRGNGEQVACRCPPRSTQLKFSPIKPGSTRRASRSFPIRTLPRFLVPPTQRGCSSRWNLEPGRCAQPARQVSRPQGPAPVLQPPQGAGHHFRQFTKTRPTRQTRMPAALVRVGRSRKNATPTGTSRIPTAVFDMRPAVVMRQPAR